MKGSVMTRVQKYRATKRRYLRRRRRQLHPSYTYVGHSRGPVPPGAVRRPAWIMVDIPLPMGSVGIKPGHLLNATFVPLSLLRAAGKVTGGGRGVAPHAKLFPLLTYPYPYASHGRGEAIGMYLRAATPCGKKASKWGREDRIQWGARRFFDANGYWPYYELTGAEPREDPPPGP